MPLAGLGGERREVGIKGPTKKELFSALSSRRELEFSGEISGLPIKMKIRGILWKNDSSDEELILLCIGSSDREINGEYNTRTKIGHLVYYQD